MTPQCARYLPEVSAPALIQGRACSLFTQSPAFVVNARARSSAVLVLLGTPDPRGHRSAQQEPDAALATVDLAAARGKGGGGVVGKPAGN